MKNQKVRGRVVRHAFLPIVLMIFSVTFAQHPGWTQYMNGNQINAVAAYGNDIWVGTTCGLVKIDKSSSLTIFYNSANSGLPDNHIRSIAIDGNGTKWIGTQSGGLAKFDGVSWAVYNTTNSGLPDNEVSFIAIDGSGSKWIGTDNGLSEFDGNAWTVYNVTNSGLPDNYVTSIAIDGSGNKWIGTDGDGLAKFDGATWTVYNDTNSGLPGDYVASIAIDGGGNKWIGTAFGGLAKFNDATWTVYSSSNSGLPDNTVNSIAIDGSGIKWIGTFGGLAKFNGATWSVYNTLNSGLLDNNVTSIAIEGKGNIWIGEYNGGLAVFSDNNSAIKLNHGSALNQHAPLCWNYPNPFKQKTLINYNVLENGPVSLRIYSLDGHLIQTLVNARQTAGYYSVSWDGKNDKGKVIARGVYLYQLKSNGGMISKKMSFIE